MVPNLAGPNPTKTPAVSLADCVTVQTQQAIVRSPLKPSQTKPWPAEPAKPELFIKDGLWVAGTVPVVRLASDPGGGGGRLSGRRLAGGSGGRGFLPGGGGSSSTPGSRLPALIIARYIQLHVEVFSYDIPI
jgi:hypothetical protein